MTNQLRKIESVGALSGYRLSVLLDDGVFLTVDLSKQVERGGVFSALKDKNSFAQVRVGYRRRTIEWPWPHDKEGNALIDIDAESLANMATHETV